MRPIYEIAQEISRSWKPVNYAAKPYLDAMFSLSSINDKYFADDGQTVVAYFLGNTQSWRGEDAKRIKKELKLLLSKKADNDIKGIST
jgi:hypothetical protein